MQHILFGESYDTAILINAGGLDTEAIERTYFGNGLDRESCIAFSLDYGGKKKPTKTIQRDYLKELLPVLVNCGVKHLFVCDGEYFKTLTKKTKAEPYYGYVQRCALEGYEDLTVTLGLNHRQLFYNPALLSKCILSIDALNDHKKGSYIALGANALQTAVYPQTIDDIRLFLNSLHKHPELTCDIEAFSLKHHDAGIGTIAFAWDKHGGGAFSVDYVALTTPEKRPTWCDKDKKYKQKLHYGEHIHNAQVRALLKNFFETYEGKLTYHNITYDAYVLTYQLWMTDLIDAVGLLDGLAIMTRNFDDTQLITYLATNSCAGNKLSLKDQTHEYLGNYAQGDINDIRLIPEAQLLDYNLRDCLGTWYVKEKHYDTMVHDEQLPIYRDLFKPCVVDIIQMQLTGLCLDMDAVLHAEKDMIAERKHCIDTLLNHPVVKRFTLEQRMAEVHHYNTTRVKKRITLEDAKFEFNPNSPVQVQQLLYEIMELEVVDYTDTKQPAVGSKTLDKLVTRMENNTELTPEKVKSNITILQALIDFSKVDKVLSSFIPAFKRAPLAPDGHYYLYGSYKLGGTVSGRLSSSNPNMQNIPSGSKFAKVIKGCFIAPEGYLFGGADFASLEDRISALTTRDVNKLKVYTDGYDGHMYRAYNYWTELFPQVNQVTAAVINALMDDEANDKVRSRSKAPTFLLTYGGSWMGLVKNCGFSEEEAKAIEANYHKLYVQSDEWVDAHINNACKVGYVTGAFGLRVRTPLLKQVIRGTRQTPHEAEAEGRTAGNALGQSWCLLNGRACMEFMIRVRNSEHKYAIRLGAQIHDAIYIYWKDDIALTEWVNTNLAECMAWQEHPDIQHDEVKLFGELDIFYPTWKDATTLPNGINQEQIIQICKAEAKKRKEK